MYRHRKSTRCPLRTASPRWDLTCSTAWPQRCTSTRRRSGRRGRLHRAEEGSGTWLPSGSAKSTTGVEADSLPQHHAAARAAGALCLPGQHPPMLSGCSRGSPHAAPSLLQTAGEVHARPAVEVVLQHCFKGSMHSDPHFAVPEGQPVGRHGAAGQWATHIAIGLQAACQGPPLTRRTVHCASIRLARRSAWSRPGLTAGTAIRETGQGRGALQAHCGVVLAALRGEDAGAAAGELAGGAGCSGRWGVGWAPPVMHLKPGEAWAELSCAARTAGCIDATAGSCLRPAHRTQIRRCCKSVAPCTSGPQWSCSCNTVS